jgi:hypothetical protein
MVETHSKPPAKHKSCFGEAYSDPDKALACAFCHESKGCLDTKFKKIREQVEEIVKKVQKL